MNVDHAEYELLRRLARANDVSIAWVVRRAVRAYLGGCPPGLDLPTCAEPTPVDRADAR